MNHYSYLLKLQHQKSLRCDGTAQRRKERAPKAVDCYLSRRLSWRKEKRKRFVVECDINNPLLLGRDCVPHSATRQGYCAKARQTFRQDSLLLTIVDGNRSVDPCACSSHYPPLPEKKKPVLRLGRCRYYRRFFHHSPIVESISAAV